MSEEKPTWRASYRWVITRDFAWERSIKDGETDFVQKPEVARSGPWNVDPSMKLTKCFRMYVIDGDEREWVYEGWASKDCDFEPLDDFGRPNYGCEGICYWSSREMDWEHV